MKHANKVLVGAAALALGISGTAVAQESTTPESQAGAMKQQPSESTSDESQPSEQTKEAVRAGEAGKIEFSQLSEDERIRLQERLKSLGYYDDKVDAVVGPKTKQALRQFQESQGMEGTGNLDQATAKALGLSLEVQPVLGEGSAELEPQSGTEPKAAESAGADAGQGSEAKSGEAESMSHEKSERDEY